MPPHVTWDASFGRRANRVQMVKLQKISLSEERQKLQHRLTRASERLIKIQQELDILRTQKQKFVDTDIWQEGILQRIDRKELLKYLESEIRNTTQSRAEMAGEHEVVTTQVHEVNSEETRLRKEADRLSKARLYFAAQLSLITNKTIAEEAREELKREQIAEKQAEEHQRNDIHDAIADTSLAGNSRLALNVRLLRDIIVLTRS